ncbi:protein translocase subunit SecD [Dokdonella sp.]|uniref:protein translocase subunit SecD n=1 Tax=Dokdonella sp. TaxID=2291710 RepID=UPI0031CB6CBA|nr:protein translocase subunit SecD [Dokdonella sp.]
MNDFPRWKYALVVVVIILGVLYGIPNLFVQQPAVQISANRGAPIDAALKEKVQGVLEKNKLTFDEIELTDSHLLVRLPVGNTEEQAKAQELLKTELGDQYIVALNLASTVPEWLLAIGAREMPKGLDLQGGVHFLMQVDDKEVMEKQLQRYGDDIRAALRDDNIRYQSVGRGPQGLVVQLRSEADRDAALSLIQLKVPDVEVASGARVGDAWTLNVSVRPDKIREIAQNTIRQNVATLGNRINALGVAEPLIQQQGETRIAVELPGVQDTAEAKKILGATATLEYHAVDESANALDAARSGQIPPDDKLYYRRETGPDGKPVPILLKKKIIVSGDEVVGATSAPDPQSGTPAVSVTLNATGGRKMLDFTSANVGKPMAVVYIERTPEVKIVDGKEVRSAKVTEEVISVATIRGVFSTQFQTTGLESNKEAAELALLLRSGSLAAPMDIVEERVIGPSLGKDNISKGVNAVLLGLLAVLVFMAFYYWVFGLIADLALFFNLVLLLAIMSAIGVTLTMPGIAGIVLTLGMAIDANVLICERVREELRNGSTPLASIRAGYEKAWATILDANVTHLLAALALMTLGSGAIRGFGVTLFIGILTSMFTSVTVTHAITNLVHARSGRKRKGLSIGSGYARLGA